jgi:hypothetical protein
VLASKKDKEIEANRDIYGQSIVQWSTTQSSISAISIDDFDRMTPTMQAEYTNSMTAKYWKIKFK